MTHAAMMKLAPVVLILGSAALQQAQATTKTVTFNVLNASATLPAPLLSGDNLRLNTLVTTEVGALLQTITFSLGAGVGSFVGEAAWEINTATGTGPRLVGVNIDIFNSSNALVASDSFAGTLAGFALSSFPNTPIGPGTYKLVATGTAVRDASLDLTLSFVNAVPEPGTYGLMLAGMGVLGFLVRRRAA